MAPPLVEIARQHLHHDTISFDPDPGAMRLAATYTGIGLDHFGGEEPIALADEREVAKTTGAVMGFLNDNWKAEHFVGALLTTRRLIVGNLDAVAFVLEGLEGARIVSGLLGSSIEMAGITTTGQRAVKKEDLDCKEQLARFIQTLVTVPPSYRPIYPTTTELAFPSPADPTGARHALSATRNADSRVVILLEVVAAALSQGMPADVGLDLVRRIRLFDRNERYGRGQSRGFWLSPLVGPDLETIAHLELQTCTKRYVGHNNVLELEFRWDSSLARAAAHAAAGELAVRAFGIGWYEVPQTTITTVRLADFSPVSGFLVRACSGDRFTVAPRGDDLGFVQDLYEAISEHEARALLLRALFGFSAPLQQLHHTTRAELEQRVYHLIGKHDLTAFFPLPEIA